MTMNKGTLERVEDKQPTRNVLVSTEGGNDGGLVGQGDLVVRVGGEQALEKRDSRVENNRALGSGLDADLDFAIVYEVRADSRNVGGRRAVEVGGADEGSQLMGLDLNLTAS